jgi:hypothetical protein
VTAMARSPVAARDVPAQAQLLPVGQQSDCPVPGAQLPGAPRARPRPREAAGPEGLLQDGPAMACRLLATARRQAPRSDGLAGAHLLPVQATPREAWRLVRHWGAPSRAAEAVANRAADGQGWRQASPSGAPSAAASGALWAAHAVAPARPADGLAPSEPAASVRQPEVAAQLAASARRVGPAEAPDARSVVAPVEQQDARPGAVAASGPSAVRAAEHLAVTAVRGAAPLQGAALERPSPAAASALPSAAASACRPDRALPFVPARRQSARPRRATRSLQIASPLAQSWRAAGDEVWSCDVGSRN